MFSFARKVKNETAAAALPVGRRGEDAATAYLKKKGYTIVERNYRKRFGEIDIVARDGDTLVFVEVKTRSSKQYGSPFEAVDQRKQKKMAKVAMDYISRNNKENTPARFDVVAVMLTNNKAPDIELIQNAFEVE